MYYSLLKTIGNLKLYRKYDRSIIKNSTYETISVKIDDEDKKNKETKEGTLKQTMLHKSFQQ